MNADARLHRLREALRLEWGELATRLNMSRSMLDFVRKGQRNLSFKALRRVEECERDAGLLPQIQTAQVPPKPTNEKNLKFQISETDVKKIMEHLSAIMKIIEKTGSGG